jgi:hypothetical protein
VSGLAKRAVVGAALAGAIAVSAQSQPAPPAGAGPVSCEELRALAHSKEEVRKSLSSSETMAQTLMELAKSKMEEIEACKGGPSQPSCAPGQQSERREEVRRVMAQVRELRTARATIEAALKEVDAQLKEALAKRNDGCPDVKR